MGNQRRRGNFERMAGALKHPDGILGTLRQEHEEVADLMAQIDVGDGRADLHARNDLFERVRSELLIHARAEQRVFYEACKSHDRLRGLVEHAEDEHREIEHLVERLSTEALDGPTWMETFLQLQERVAHHVREEEQKVFREAREVMEPDDLRRLDDEYGSERLHVERRLPPVELPGGPFSPERRM